MKAPATKSLPSRAKRWWADCDKGGKLAVLIVLGILLATLAWLKWGDDPWRHGLPQAYFAGKKLDTQNSIVLGLWFGAAINAVIATALLATSCWWARQPNRIEPPQRPPLPQWSRRLFWWGLAAALLAAAWVRAPRLEHSFWNDEELAFRHFLWGRNIVTDSGNLKFEPVSWQHTLFTTGSGNNHVTQTVQSRLAHGLWKKFFHREGDSPFKESVIRLPPFINGLLGIAALALLLRLAGYPLAGATAAWILALNPWHLRYSVEARGYADLMLLIPLTFICLLLALRSGQWRWWLGYGLFQSLYLLSFAGAIYVAMAQNLIVLAVVIKRHQAIHFWRWTVSTAIGATLFIQIMTPMAIRIAIYMETHKHNNFPITLAHLQDLWAHLVFGSQWKTQAAPNLYNGLSVEIYQSAHPATLPLMTFVIPTLVTIGTLGALVKGRELWLFVCTLLGALALTALHNATADLTYYIWYAIYLVLGFALALGFVPELVAGGWKSLKKNHSPSASVALPIATAILIVTGYGWMTSPSLAQVRDFERHPMKAAVEVVRGNAPALAAANSNTLTCSIGSGSPQIQTYDPWVRPVKEQVDFDGLLKDARQSGKPLFVYACSPLRVQREFPGAWEQLENNQLFEKVIYLKGLEEFWSLQIYRFKMAP